ncbi:MAG: hypothetical protein ACRKGH_07540 [Dehalogenimonas sp.]
MSGEILKKSLLYTSPIIGVALVSVIFSINLILNPAEELGVTPPTTTPAPTQTTPAPTQTTPAPTQTTPTPTLPPGDGEF